MTIFSSSSFGFFKAKASKPQPRYYATVISQYVSINDLREFLNRVFCHSGPDGTSWIFDYKIEVGFFLLFSIFSFLFSALNADFDFLVVLVVKEYASCTHPLPAPRQSRDVTASPT